MGIGSARGDDRAVAAAEMAISSPLLEASIDGAHGVLLSIQGGSDLGLFEINEAAQLVSNSAAPEANIIFGAVIDDALGDEVRVTVIAAGFDEHGDSRGQAGQAGIGGSSFSTSDAAAPAWRAPAPAAPAAPPAPAPRPEPLAAPLAAPVSTDTPGSSSATPPPATPKPDFSPAPPSEPDSDASPEASVGPAKLDGVPAPRPADSAGGDKPAAGASRPADPAPARLGESSSSGTRRRSVVFEEDDELDVPDFLK
jgi:cell division protein FtsZ